MSRKPLRATFRVIENCMKSSLSISLSLVSLVTMVHMRAVRSQNTPANFADSIQEKKIKLQLYFMGYFYVPDGFKAYETESFMDAWFGYIVSPDATLRIRYSAGMATTPFQDGEVGYLWVKRETRGKINLRYGLRRTVEGQEIAAVVPGMSFYATVKTQDDINQFLDIVRSYKVGRCADCQRALPQPSTKQTPVPDMALLKERENRYRIML